MADEEKLKEKGNQPDKTYDGEGGGYRPESTYSPEISTEPGQGKESRIPPTSGRKKPGVADDSFSTYPNVSDDPEFIPKDYPKNEKGETSQGNHGVHRKYVHRIRGVENGGEESDIITAFRSQSIKLWDRSTILKSYELHERNGI